MILAELDGERVRTIGLSPDLVLVSSDKWMNGGAAIYTVNKSSGAAKTTRPRRTDGSFSSRLWATGSTLVSLDVYQAAGTQQFLSHCSIADCQDTLPPLDSHMPNLIFDFAVDEVLARAYWFDPTTRELMSTVADAWAPTTAGTISAPPQSAGDERAITFANGIVYVALTDWIAKVPVNGASAPVSVSGHPGSDTGWTLQRMAATPDSLVLQYTSGNLYRVPLPGGIGYRVPDPIQGPAGVVAIVTAGSTLFWAGSSTIFTCTLPLCADRQPLATDDQLIQDLAVDDSAVYWLSEASDYSSARVMRLSR